MPRYPSVAPRPELEPHGGHWDLRDLGPPVSARACSSPVWEKSCSKASVRVPHPHSLGVALKNPFLTIKREEETLPSSPHCCLPETDLIWAGVLRFGTRQGWFWERGLWLQGRISMPSQFSPHNLGQEAQSPSPAPCPGKSRDLFSPGLAAPLLQAPRAPAPRSG